MMMEWMNGWWIINKWYEWMNDDEWWMNNEWWWISMNDMNDDDDMDLMMNQWMMMNE